MSMREQIAEVLHDFYIEASMRKITREEFEAFIDRIIALFPVVRQTGTPDRPPREA
ncbi:MAG: hypothetical protein JW889_10570 [Verrucomicrobia bacterium]|nr:hypothetical protein [Verrucomicrobiota bacterium]